MSDNRDCLAVHARHQPKCAFDLLAQFLSSDQVQDHAGIEDVRLAQFLNSPSAASSSSSVSSPGHVPKKAATPPRAV
jgi:hypothetical protein